MNPDTTTDPNPDAQQSLAALLRRLDSLGQMDLPPAAHAVLAAAQADAAALGRWLTPGTDAGVDHAAFDRLMDLAGPQLAPDLLRQLAQDLTAVATALDPALGRGDVAGVRAQTHILMALAGSVGAQALYGAAVRLNRAAHLGDAPRDIGHDVLTGLAALRRFVDGRLPPLGGGG